VATQHSDNIPSVVDEYVLSEICWKEYDGERREFNYINLIRIITFIKSGRSRHVRRDYSEAVTYALEQLGIPKEEWTVIRAKASAYFKAMKHPNELDDMYWDVTVSEKTREIFLYHLSSMSRSESLYNNHGFDLGSVVIEGRPCRHKRLVELHRRKCFEVTYRILTGRLS
jgi:hypothetical protein